MVITRTPFRVSFFGGGTDFPGWYRENGGSVLSTTIDKYCYINCRPLPPFFEHKHRIVYSKIELVNDLDNIIHPAAKEIMRFMKIDTGLEIHHDGDLPARTGLGSSSSFTVGLLNALYALNGKMVTKRQLALDAIYVEQEMIKENVGSQDQVAVAFGGFNRIGFSGNHNIEVNPITISQSKIDLLQDHLALFFTGFTRFATEIEAEKIKNISNKKIELETISKMVDEAINILNSDVNLLDFGKLLHEGWKVKKSLSNKVSNPLIDEIYDLALRNNAIGGKILGAGGGGFILFFVKPEERQKLINAMGKLLYVPFRFEMLGSQIVYYAIH